MNTLPIVSIVIGVVLILGRAPLLFAPTTALNIIRSIIGNIARLRLMGTLVLLFGALMIIVATTIEKSYPGTVLGLGCLFAIVGGSMVVIPIAIQKLAIRIWSMSHTQARILGLISVLFGVYLIYLGLRFILC